MLKKLFIFIILILFWQGIVILFKLPNFILPSPFAVINSLIINYNLLFQEFIITFLEIILGFIFSIIFGIISAIILDVFKFAKAWFLPMLLISQAFPTFAIAPILVLWFGYGIASKVILIIIALFFPITNSFYEGLKSVPIEWLDLGRLFTSGIRYAKWRMLFLIKIPAALPKLAIGIRTASAIAPISAIVGEWVGASQGLGFLMLNANARLQIDLMFAALLILIVFTLGLYFFTDKVLRKLIPWEEC